MHKITMENKQPGKLSTGWIIALVLFWPVMIYLGYKAGKIKFYNMIIVINMIISVILGYFGVPWYFSIVITSGFYYYFAYRLDELRNYKQKSNFSVI